MPVIHAEEVETEKVIVVYKEQVNEKLFTNLDGEIEGSYENIPILVGEMPVNVIDVLENGTSMAHHMQPASWHYIKKLIQI